MSYALCGARNCWEFFAGELGEPADFGGVAYGEEFARDFPAQEVDQNVMVMDAVFGIEQDAVVDSEQFAGFDDESGFLARFANGGLSTTSFRTLNTTQFAQIPNANVKTATTAKPGDLCNCRNA